jgi:putative ABC transport system permease protein
MYYLFVDFDFLKTYGIEMVAGRSFNKLMQTDAESTFLINEKAVNAFGWARSEEAIGKKLKAGFQREGEIIGVYKDFHYRSLQTPIEPLILAIVPWRFNHISLKLNTTELPATMAFVEKKWQELFPGNPYAYSFLDEEFDKQYTADEKMGRTFLFFTGIAIFIACLGLFGLATYVARQRTKEIGIRKVMGASVTGIVALLSMDFVKLIIVSALISTPLSYLLISKWLENFAFRIDIGWVTFVVAGIAILTIALLTVSFQSIKAALMNPVESLRTE